MRIRVREGKLRLEFSLWSLLVVGISFAFSIASLTSRVDYTRCDPHGALLTSQALLKTGHLWLDPYLARSDSATYGITEQNHHIVYFFPIGTPVLSVPAVALVLASGGDLQHQAQDRVLQRLLAALSVALALICLYALGRRFLAPAASLILAATFVGGSSFISTAGTALWSLNYGFVLTVVAMWLLLRRDDERSSKRMQSVILAAISFFLAFLCRPTFAIPGLLFALETIIRDRRAGMLFVATGVLCAIPTVLFSLREYGTLLPAYYLPGRIEGHADLLKSMPGHLISPGRGVFLYNPFLLTLLIVLPFTFRRWGKTRLAWLSICWIVAHLFVISKFPHWWGGWSYGSRLFADALPAFALLTIIVYLDLRNSPQRGLARLAVSLFLAGATLGFWINTNQGLRNPATVAWNGSPDVDTYPAKLFDWKYPQFLASPGRIAAQGREYYVGRLQPIPLGQVIKPDSPYLYLENWYPYEHDGDDQWRWSCGKIVRIWFRDHSREPITGVTSAIGAFGEQTISLHCDGVLLNTFTQEGFEPTVMTWKLPAHTGNGSDPLVRCLEFNIPRASRAKGKIGMGLHWLRFDTSKN